VDLSPVTANFFPLLGIDPILGRHFEPGEEVNNGPKVAMISHALWKRRYGGDPDLVGGTIQIDHVEHTVVGILPGSFRLLLPPEAFLLKHSDIWTPLQIDYGELPPRNFTFFTVFGRLKPGVTFHQAQADMDRIAADLRATHAVHESSNLKIRVVPLHYDVVKNAQPALVALLGAVGFVLLIVCANVANLLLARGTAKEKELAIQAALGAGRFRITRRLLIESLLLALAGGTAGLVIAEAGVTALMALRPANLPRLTEIRIDETVLVFASGVTLVTAIVFGLMPALHGARVDLVSSLKAGRRGAGSAGHNRIRNVLVMAEVALSLILLVGAGLMIRSFSSLQQVRPGFNPNGLLTLNLSLAGSQYAEDEPRRVFYQELKEKLSALPGVVSVGAATQLPLTGSGSLQPYAYDEETARNWESVTADDRGVSPNFFRTMGTRLMAGRFFTEQDSGNDRSVIVIDTTLADRVWPGGNAVGRRLQVEPTGSEEPFDEVVGVIEHVRIHDLSADVRPQIYFPASWGRTFSVVLRAEGDPATLTHLVRAEVASLDPDLPVHDLRPMTAYVEDAMAQSRFSLTLMAIFGVVALVITSLGIYGVISYYVGQQTHEIGIRMALGEGPGQVRKRVLAQGMKLIGAGAVLGLVASLVLARSLSSLLFEVGTADPWSFGGALVFLLLIALAACFGPAFRASRVDPLIALRTE
jgi:putative ABC transport system permease protein